MISRHQHIWKVESQTEQPSAWEQMNADSKVTSLKGQNELFIKPLIVTYKCVACGSQKVERV